MHSLTQCFGIRDNTLKWFTSYRTLRTQSVKEFFLNDILSETVPLLYGSLPGQTLFTLCTASLSRVIDGFNDISQE